MRVSHRLPWRRCRSITLKVQWQRDCTERPAEFFPMAVHTYLAELPGQPLELTSDYRADRVLEWRGKQCVDVDFKRLFLSIRGVLHIRY